MEKENINNQPSTENNGIAGKSKAVGFLTFIIIVLIIVLSILGWRYLQQIRAAREVETQLIAEKDSITHNLKNLLVEYDQLETTNDSLNRKLAEEQNKVKGLYQEIQTLQKVSYAKIKEYQRELGTLRSIMKGLLHDVDSLNAMNQKLVAENIKVKEEASVAKKTVKELEQKTQELNSKIEVGSVIRARGVTAIAVNKRGGEVTRARRVEKIKTCFTLSENAIAKAGSRYVYLRIIGPDDFILAKSETDVFDFQGEKIVFSAKREVDYQNQDVDMCIFYDNNGELLAGKYGITIYLDGELVGNGELILK